MPETSLVLFILVVLLAIGFGLSNGFNDAANAVATVIGTRVLSPRNAVIMAAFLNFLGAATGLEVARTIGKGILVPEAMTFLTVVAGLSSAVIWVTLATYYGLPLSVTHSLIAGLAGAGIAVMGIGTVQWATMVRVLASVVIAPVLGFVAGFILMVILYWVFRRSTSSRVQAIFGKLQIISAAFMAYSHGKNDGQMPIGVITMALVIYTGQNELWDNIPLWVIVLSSLSISLGTIVGGWRVIKTLGVKVTTLRPVQGFAAETSGATVIEVASLLGIPVSTTHCITTAIMGVGATRRFSAVRWGVASNIVAAWIFTFPICAGLGYLFAWVMKSVL
ncbi:MAG: inorganic phosphate transporter [Dehalococcoidales bacterium]|nr:inorganic phosphate transporter [Dehalococcoidales bacterium]